MNRLQHNLGNMAESKVSERLRFSTIGRTRKRGAGPSGHPSNDGPAKIAARRLYARRRDYDATLTSKAGYTKPGSMNPRKC